MSEVQTLARGLKIVDLLADTEAGLTASDLIEQIGIDKSGISRLMKTLVKYGYVDRDDETRRYHLGVHVHDLGQRAGQHAVLRELVQPYLARLRAQTDENAHAAVYSSAQALTIADEPSNQPLRVVSEVGRRMPLHCSAVGKCLLAFTGHAVPATLPRYTANTLTEPAQLERALATIRQQAYALDDEELTVGVRGLAVPIRNREGRTVATVGLSGPTVRLTDSSLPRLVEQLQAAASAISQALGYLE